LRSVLLQLHDFPPSWRMFAAPAAQRDVLGGLAACTGDARGAGRAAAVVKSGEFRNGRRHITSMAVAYDSQQPVTQHMASLSSPKADGCIAKVIRPQVLAAAPSASITSQQFTVTSGSYNVAANVEGSATGVVHVRLAGRPVGVHVDIAFITGAHYYAEVTFIGVGAPVPAYIRKDLTDDIAFRAQRT
jgi:hypothetical protein